MSFLEQLGKTGLLETIGEMGQWLVFLTAVFIGFLAFTYQNNRNWRLLTRTLRTKLTGDIATNRIGVGVLEFDDDSAITVATSITTEGIVLFKMKRKLDRKHGLFIPWSEIRGIYVWTPKRLSSCRSSEDCDSLAEDLEADLDLGKPKLKTLKIPWNYHFNRSMPPDVKLTMNWEWPYPLTEG